MRSGDHGSDGRGAALVASLRAHSSAGFAHQAEHYRQVWAITTLVHAQEGWRVGEGSRADALGCGRITEHDLDVLAAAEVAAATGLSQFGAERDVLVARAVCTVLTGDPGGAGGRTGRRPPGPGAGRGDHRPDRPAGAHGRGDGAGRPAGAAAGRDRPGRAVGRADTGRVRAAGEDRRRQGADGRRGARPPRRARTDRDPDLDPPGVPGPVDDDGHRPDRPGPDHRHHPGRRQPRPDPRRAGRPDPRHRRPRPARSTPSAATGRVQPVVESSASSAWS